MTKPAILTAIDEALVETLPAGIQAAAFGEFFSAVLTAIFFTFRSPTRTSSFVRSRLMTVSDTRLRTRR